MLPQIKGVPVVPLSARTGEGLDRLMAAVMESYAVWNRRVPTAALNRFLQRSRDEPIRRLQLPAGACGSIT